MILIVGASGNLGTALSSRALNAGKSVRALSRKPEDRLSELKEQGAETVTGDLRDRVSLDKACAGVTHVVAAAHSALGRGAEKSFHVDFIGNRNLIDAAKAAGVKHFIFISAMGASPDHPAPLLRFKYQTEEYLKESGLPYTIIRPTFFMETYAWFLNGKSFLEKGKTTLYGKGNTKKNYVLIKDVADFISQVWDDPMATGQTFEIGGPLENNLSDNEVLAIFEKVAGKKAKVTRVPRGMMRVMSPLLKPVHAGMSQIMTILLHLDSIDHSFDTSQVLQRYPLKMTTLDEWVNNSFQKEN
jgi:uncharacterized protein YbjT (DUF2867 family)